MGKRAEMSTEKIIVIILVIIVIATILMFIFKSDIKAYFGNLPGYQSSQEDKEITQTGTSNLAVSTLCPVKVGKAVYVPKYLSRDYAQIYINGEATDILWYPATNNIELDRWSNVHLGEVSNAGGKRIISIDYNAGARYDNMPSQEKVNQLDGAWILSDNNICRDK